MGISIARWLAASMWDFLLFVFSRQPPPSYYIPPIAMSMAHAHVLRESWKGLRMSKVWNNCLACHWGCAWFEYFVWWRWSIARPYDFVVITFFGHVILKTHDCFISRLEVLFCMSNDRLLLWITRILIFMPWLDYMIKIMLGSIPHQKLSFLSFTYSRTSRN